MHSQRTAKREIITGNAGFSLIELMIAIAILSIGIMAVASLQVSAIAGNSKGRKIAEELTMAESQLENLMVQPYTSAALDPAANPHQVVSGAYTMDWNIFMMDLNGDGVDDAKRVEMTVSCQGRNSRSTTLEHIIAE
jgi:prepilin-type N-terminal cleavage/methylation domain-containing protein